MKKYIYSEDVNRKFIDKAWSSFSIYEADRNKIQHANLFCLPSILGYGFGLK